MPHIVMGAPLGLSGTHRQQRLRTVQCLNLGFLIHAQHQGFIWRMQIQADDIPHLFNEQRVLGKLKGFGTMWLQSERTPDAADRALAKRAATSHRAGRPVRGVGWTFLQRQGEHALDGGIANLSRSARARLIQQPIQTPRHKAAAPLSHRGFGQLHLLRHLRVRFPFRAAQDDPRPQGQGLGGSRTPHPALQRLAFLLAQLQRLNRSPQRHKHLPCTLDAGKLKLIKRISDS